MMRLPPRLAHKLSSVTGWPFRVLLCGLVFTAAVTWNVNTRVTRELQNQFELHADRLQGDAQRRLNQPLYGLMGARGMLAAMPQFTQAQFRAYVESRDLDREFPGARGFGWIERVARADLSAFVAAVQADNAAQFAVRTGGTASDLYVIRHIEPLANNRSAWGFDVGSDAVRRAAVEQAVRSGQATLTAPVVLQQDAQRSPGFLLLLPVYTRGAVVDTPEQRQRHLRGLLYAPIVAHEILADVTVIADGQLDFKVYDGPVVDASRLVYDDDHLTRAAGSQPTDLQRRHTALRSIAIGDRQLSLQANSLQAFHVTHHSALPAVVGAAGVLLSLLVAGLTAVLVRGRQRVEARAQELTQDLSRLAMVAKHTSNVVIVTDVARRITWVNDGFSRTTGYSFAEAMGCNPGKLLQFDDTDPATIAELRASLDAGRAYRCTLLNRAKDGRVYWIDLEVQPLRTDSGVLESFMAVMSDVTAARQAADVLALERTRLAALLAATGAGAAEWDLRRDTLDFNDRFAELQGYSREEFSDMTMTRLLTMVHADDRDAVVHAVQVHLRGEATSFEAEYRLRHKRGHWVDILAHGLVLTRSADGTPQSMAGTQIDISQRKAAEQRWQARAEMSGDWFWQTDTEHRFVEMSEGVEYRMMFTPSKVLGLRRDEVEWFEPPAEGWALLHQRLERHEAFAGLSYRTHAQPDNPRWLEIDGRPRFDRGGAFLGYEGVGRDITERLADTVKLRESLTLVDALFEAIPVPVLLKDRDGRYLRANKTYANMLGVTPAELIGKRSKDVVDDAAARLHDVADAELMAQPGQRTYEVSVQLRDGRHLDTLVSKCTLMAADGATAIGIVSTVVDISAQRAAVRATLEAKEAAEAANSAKSAFLATMSHEIRTPMNGVIGMAELLAHSTLDDEQAQTVGTIHESAHALLRIIDDILDFSKIEAGRLELEDEVFELTPLVEGVCEALAAVANPRKVQLWVDVDPGVSERVRGDAGRLRQVLNNLVGNAIKFSAGQADRDGRVEVRLSAEGAQSEHGGELHFSVADNGIGMDEATLARLFTPFTQAEVSTTRRFGGTGLGLAISRRLAEMMGGHIEVRSQPGAGSTFCLRLKLPVTDDQPESLTPDLNGVHCVLVSEGELPQEALQRWLQQAGASVHNADTDAAGAALAANLPGPTVLVADERCQAHDTLPAGPVPYPGAAGADLRRLRVGRGRRGPARVLQPGLAQLDLLRRLHFLQAVAMLAGRESPVLPVLPVDTSVLHAGVAPTVAQAQQEGRLILVAEDDAINRAVISRQLALLGHAAELAEDGVQALALWRSGRHALLLTDLHMPAMDGYTLAQTIRADEAASGAARQPILALTANALKGEAVRARAAGIDDYITKPVPLNLLRAALAQWLPAALPTALPTASAGALAGAPLPSAPSVLDVQCLRNLVGDDEATLQELLADFAAQAEDQTATLLQALQQGDRTTTVQTAHKLKSSSRAVGALALADLCERAEALPPGATLAGRQALVLAMQVTLQATLARLPAPVSHANESHQ